MRVEFIRFTLLITLTIGLISVAARHGGSHHGTTQASHSSSPSASASPGGTAASGGGAAAGQASGTGSQGTGRQSTGSSGSGTGSNGSAGAQVVPMLPRTGAAQVTELAGLAALFIAGGAFSMTVSRRSVR